MNKVHLFLKNNSSTILSIIGSVGVVATSVLAVKATPKAMKLIEFEKNMNNTDELSKSKIIKVAWKPYIPSILCGVSTITCIFGSNYINKKNQKALISAYGMLNTAYLNYKSKVNKLYGNEANKKIYKEIARSQKIEKVKIEDNEELFFDMESMRYFSSSIEKIREAEELFNEHLHYDGYAYLNDLYDLLGLEHVDYGYEIGWSTYSNDKMYSYDEVRFNIDLTDIDDDMECNILTLSWEPSMDFVH